MARVDEGGWRRAARAWMQEQGTDLPLRLTLLCLLLAPVGAWYLRPLVLVLAGAGLLHVGVLRSHWTWLALALATGARVVLDWPLGDNHAFLLSYWCLAIGLFRAFDSPSAALARTARLLIGLVMALAVLWKGLLAPDFVDGRFFRVVFLTEGRFADVARLGGIDEVALERAGALLEKNRHDPETTAPAELEPPALRRIAVAATWMTLGLEAAVALLFLLPAGFRMTRCRDVALLVFCASTYAVAPVPGFGWLLLAMGSAQCTSEPLRFGYVGCFGLVVLHDHVPWLEIVHRIAT